MTYDAGVGRRGPKPRPPDELLSTQTYQVKPPDEELIREAFEADAKDGEALTTWKGRKLAELARRIVQRHGK